MFVVQLNVSNFSCSVPDSQGFDQEFPSAIVGRITIPVVPIATDVLLKSRSCAIPACNERSHMKISVVDPISRAVDRTNYVLFQTFDFGKWITLTFCAFLAMLGEGRSSYLSCNTGGLGRLGGGPGGPDLDFLWQWKEENETIIIVILAAILVVGCLIGVLVCWLSCRGQFLFIDSIVHNRAGVVARVSARK